MRRPTIADIDPWLEPYRAKLEHQSAFMDSQERRILDGKSPAEFALGYTYFGLHATDDGWVLREWAPNATHIHLISAHTNWEEHADYMFAPLKNGVWELTLQKEALAHLDHYKLLVRWDGGSGERIPSYATYVLQDPTTNAFDAVVWNTDTPYQWQDGAFEAPTEPLLIYEAHIGMASEGNAIASYEHFSDEILPRIVALGYNTIQLMAIQEHPYYGSFGYHVSNFFAASSRFGTPDDLKKLVDTAHQHGLRVILDIVHSHAVKNEVEGLSRFDGTTNQYFHEGDRGNHEAWDSRTFDYGKPQVAHFLLSNVRWWLEEYHFDGYRFDGVTSMLYHNHGLGQTFGSYDDYTGDNVDLDALAYLRMATKVAHTVKPQSLLIAEDMSAFPGLAAPVSVGGIGFGYRLSMGVPDLWIKTLKEKTDEAWDLGHLLYELGAHRTEEKTISYAESHDQALVGDKTLIFRLIDKDMYDHMQIGDTNLVVERGIALHKMIRLITASTNGGGYLNFMGNEFGHPEWIDFPREGNNWSYHYARRQWSLVDDETLVYRYLQAFDVAMILLIKHVPSTPIEWTYVQNDQGIVSFMRGDYVFVFNFSPATSYTDFAVPAKNGAYSLILSSDDTTFGGQSRVEAAPYQAKEERLLLYLPSRTALVFKKN
jgi:1,4-alpha-glucan branching enzyme